MKIDIVDRLRFDAVRCELEFSKGIATNIDEAVAEIERLRAALRVNGLRWGHSHAEIDELIRTAHQQRAQREEGK